MMFSPLFYGYALTLLSLAHAVPQVKLGKTLISGRVVSDAVEFFGGIPYAEPPLGALRLRPPVLKTRLDAASFNATSHGKACLQPLVEDLTTLSEDCLTVSILRPAGVSAKDKLPVLFWTYGGAYAVGSSSTTDGTNLVARSVARGTPIIYVSFNHRLGPLGFPQGQEADDKRVLNLGIRDQTTALKWLQANIRVFGGDPSKVTVFGESSGSVMLNVQYLDPAFGKLARGAIFESGNLNCLPMYTAAEYEVAWTALLGNIPSCAALIGSGNTLPCVRNASTEEITAAFLQSWNNHWGLTLDEGEGSVNPGFASEIYPTGNFAKIPFIAGTNLDEGTIFSGQEALTDETLKASLLAQNGPAPAGLETALGEVLDKTLELYPDIPAIGSPYNTGDELFGLPSSYKRQSSILNDLVFLAPRRHWAKAAAKFGVKSYGYQFSHPQATPALGVTHGTEIPYVHGDIATSDPEGRSFSTAVMDYWISFTVSLDPNDGKGAERPIWPQYTEESQVLLQLEGGNTTAISDDFRGEQNDFLIQNALALRR